MIGIIHDHNHIVHVAEISAENIDIAKGGILEGAKHPTRTSCNRNRRFPVRL